MLKTEMHLWSFEENFPFAMVPFQTTDYRGERQWTILKLRNSVCYTATKSILWSISSGISPLNADHDFEHLVGHWWLRVPLDPFALKSADVSIRYGISTIAEAAVIGAIMNMLRYLS